MSRPKQPSELHPDYPKATCFEPNTAPYFSPCPVVVPVPFEVMRAFYAAHPEFKDDGEYEYRCTSCGDQIDEDHDYCQPCDQRGGEWTLVDADGEEIKS